jgi:CheY-like chemotaxis protein
VLRQLKNDDERTRAFPSLVLTGSKLTIEMVESFELGVNSYVIKPTNARRFAKVVAAIEAITGCRPTNRRHVERQRQSFTP